MKKPSPSEQLDTMLRDILNAEGEAIGCEECFEMLDQVAEFVQSGLTIEEIHPEVRKHLRDCVCCSGEFEALLTALRALPVAGDEPA